jgi:primosomal protein N' (replication factor Y)
MSQSKLFSTDPAPWELDDGDSMPVAKVIFAEGPTDAFDYSIPEHLFGRVYAGSRVRVPLGRSNRSVTAYCISVGPRGSDSRRLKPVASLIDPLPLLSPIMLDLTRWMSDYYICPWAKVIEAVVPAGVRHKAGTRETTFLEPSETAQAELDTLPAKQKAALKQLIQAGKPLTPPELADIAGCTLSPINALKKKGLVTTSVERVQNHNFVQRSLPAEPPHEFTDSQLNAWQEITAAIRGNQSDTFLLHGVTGSGKTEVYIRCIDEVVRFGRQAIVLVPEISLTPQTLERFRQRFEGVAMLHSHLSPSERHWHWQRIARGEVQVVVGARSAVFAPVPRLGLIVIDEEHDSCFKQDSQPRYHARDIAMQRAIREEVPLVLGSATPSLESFHSARQQQSRLLDLPERVASRPLPHVGIVDLRADFASQKSRGAISRALHQAIEQTLDDDGQVILLLNRRGYSTHIQCPGCGHVVKCPDCDIALTHHRDSHHAICHYCEYETPAPSRCGECGGYGIRYSGIGTQKLEQEVRSRFPSARVIRMDSDTMNRPGSHEAALTKFRSGELDILLGTQMIAKGLDFPNVTLVGVINADTALHLPDFRGGERTFQLVTQVAGRTGRGERGGRVLVQTFSPDHPAILAASRHDYEAFANTEIPARMDFGYPPFSHLSRLIVRGPIEDVTEAFADHLASRLTSQLTSEDVIRILGPAPCPVTRLRGKYRFHMLMLGQDVGRIQAIIRGAAERLQPPDEVQWVADVDAMDML